MGIDLSLPELVIEGCDYDVFLAHSTKIQKSGGVDCTGCKRDHH